MAGAAATANARHVPNAISVPFIVFLMGNTFRSFPVVKGR
jgi:hypothetical protein